MPTRRMTVADAGEVAVLISESIQYADGEAKVRTGDPDALAFPPAVNRVWTASDVLGHRGKFSTAAVYVERGRMMSAIIAQHVTRDGVRVFQPIIGGIRISEIAPEEHAAYLFKPLDLLVPEAIAAGITRQWVLYDPGHIALDAELRKFSTANDKTIRDIGPLREFASDLVLPEILAKSQRLEGRDTGR